MVMALHYEARKHMRVLYDKDRWGVLTMLIMHANVSNRCWPSVRTLAQEMGISPNKISTAKNWLLEHKAIELVPHKKRVGKELECGPRQHVYQLTGFIEIEGKRIPYFHTNPETNDIDHSIIKDTAHSNFNDTDHSIIKGDSKSSSTLNDIDHSNGSYRSDSLSNLESDPIVESNYANPPSGDLLSANAPEPKSSEPSKKALGPTPPSSAAPQLWYNHNTQQRGEIELWNENARYTAYIPLGDTNQAKGGYAVSADNLSDGQKELPGTIKSLLLNTVKTLHANMLKQPESAMFTSMSFEASAEGSHLESNSLVLIATLFIGSNFSISLRINQSTIWVGTVQFAVSTTTSTLSSMLTVSFPDHKAANMWLAIFASYALTVTNVKATDSETGAANPLPILAPPGLRWIYRTDMTRHTVAANANQPTKTKCCNEPVGSYAGLVSNPLAYVECPAYTAKAQRSVTFSDEIKNAFSKLCKKDWRIKNHATQMNGALSQLSATGAVTIELLRRFYANWYKCDFRGQKQQAPAPHQVVDKWTEYTESDDCREESFNGTADTQQAAHPAAPAPAASNNRRDAGLLADGEKLTQNQRFAILSARQAERDRNRR